MIKLDEIDKPFQELIHKATGLPLNRVLKANQGKNLPRDACCFYNVQPLMPQGAPRAFSEEVDAKDCDLPNWKDLDTTTIQRVKVRVSCNFYRYPAEDYAWMLSRCNYRQPVSDHLMLNEIQWGGSSTPNNLTALAQGEYDQRYQVDINLVVEGKVKDIILKAASIGWKIEDEKGNLLSEGDTSGTI